MTFKLPPPTLDQHVHHDRQPILVDSGTYCRTRAVVGDVIAAQTESSLSASNHTRVERGRCPAHPIG